MKGILIALIVKLDQFVRNIFTLPSVPPDYDNVC